MALALGSSLNVVFRCLVFINLLERIKSSLLNQREEDVSVRWF